MKDTKILGDHVPRKSNFDPHLAEKLTRYYEEHPEELKDKPEVQSENKPAEASIGEYILMPPSADYASGVDELQIQCARENNQNHPKFTLPDGRVVHRPLTFKENCLARLNQFNTFTNSDGSRRTLEQRTKFMVEDINSCCGIAYPSGGSSKFKLILQSPELIDISPSFNKEFYPIDYAQLPCTYELDKSEVRYNLNLDPNEIDSHKGWLALFEDDAAALCDYRQMVGIILALHTIRNRPLEYMSFCLLDVPPQKDQLKTVYVRNLVYQSCAVGGGYLNRRSNFRFLRCKP